MITLRIASYNIRKCVGLDWKRDPKRIVAVLAELDADIVLLQESDKRFRTRHGTLPVTVLYEELGYRFANIAMNDVSHGWHGNAILYRQPLQLLHAERIRIPTREPRGSVGAFFEYQGRQFFIVGAHLSLLRKTRERQIKFLAEHVSLKRYPCIIGGDFNEPQAQRWFDRARSSEHRALSGFSLISPGSTFHSAKPLFQLDRFLVTSQIHVQSAKVHQTALSRKASDHLPIVMNIQIDHAMSTLTSL